MPRGGFNVPQGSIDRSKAIDPKDYELRAGGSGTAIAAASAWLRPRPAARESTRGLTSVRTSAAGFSGPEPATSTSSDFADATLRMKSATASDEKAANGATPTDRPRRRPIWRWMPAQPKGTASFEF